MERGVKLIRGKLLVQINNKHFTLALSQFFVHTGDSTLFDISEQWSGTDKRTTDMSGYHDNPHDDLRNKSQ